MKRTALQSLGILALAIFILLPLAQVIMLSFMATLPHDVSRRGR